LSKGKCNLVECTKKLINDEGIPCIRRFPNINSENRHTHCICEDDVDEWDPKVQIQNCLGMKRNPDIDYDKNKISTTENNPGKSIENLNEFNEKQQNKNYIYTSNKITENNNSNNLENINNNDNDNDIFKNSKNQSPNDKSKNILNTMLDNSSSSNKNDDSSLNRDKKESSSHYSLNFNFDNLFNQINNQNYVHNLIDDMVNLNFIEGNNSEKNLLDDKLINEFDNFNFGSPEKIQVNKEKEVELKIDTYVKKNNISINISQETVDNVEEKKVDINIKSRKKSEDEDKIIHTLNNSLSKSEPQISVKCILDEEKIDTIFEKVHLTTKIPKTTLNKIKSAFKKKGICNAKILRLYKAKNKTWNFLIDDFKDICTQIEGVALCLENMLDEENVIIENK
jgi:hypothetical protein